MAAGTKKPTEATENIAASESPMDEMPPELTGVEGQMARFMAMLEDRLSGLERRVEARLNEVEEAATAPMEPRYAPIPPSGMIRPPVGIPDEQVTEISAQEAAAAQAAQRVVAFIPKDDPLNPKSLTFQTWLNGREIRIKRGEVGMMPLGHALNLARHGHGHVIDMDAMRSVPIERVPDLSTPDTRGSIIPANASGSSVPREVFGQLGLY